METSTDRQQATESPAGASWRQFLETGSEAAFAEVVREHVDLVYSVALRRCHGETAMAEDVVQMVFADLVRKSTRLPRNVVLAGWLHRHASFVASNTLRGEARRRHREQVAMELLDSHESVDWSRLGPVLDDALSEMSADDRDALVLRFLQRKPHAEVGRILGIGSDAARMRVDRALDRLRERLGRRGLTSTAAALALAIGHHGVVAAPAGLASQAATAAMVATAASGFSLGIFGVMNTTQISLGVAAAITAGTITHTLFTRRENSALRSDLADLRQRLATATAAPPPPEGPSPAEIQALRDDRLRLMALRDEVARLREGQKQLRRLEDENQRLRQATARRPATADEESTPNAAEEEVQKMGILRLNAAKNWAIALHQFAAEHEDRFPATITEASKYHPEANDTARLEPINDRFEVMYRGSLKDIAEPARTIVLRETESFVVHSKTHGRLMHHRTYGFADGHSEIHASADGNFEAWERERLVVDPTPREGPVGGASPVAPR